MAASAEVSPQELARLLEVRLRVKERRARLLGLDAPQRQEVTGREGGPIRYEYDFSQLSDEELEHAILAEAASITSRATTSSEQRGVQPVRANRRRMIPASRHETALRSVREAGRHVRPGCGTGRTA